MKFFAIVLLTLLLSSNNQLIYGKQDTAKIPKEFISNNNYFGIGLGGGITGFGGSLTFIYKYVGIGISFAGGNAPSEVYNCDFCFENRYSLPYDWVDTERYRRGLYDYRLLLKLPIFERFHLTGSIGYFEDKWVDVTTYRDMIYEKEVRWGDKGLISSGLSYGGGIIYDIGGWFSLGAEFTNQVGGLIFAYFTF